jgi:DNA-directed RNA polymerase specialized sigma24 family protein
VTSSILDLLASLPEASKNMFIWKHYHGWPDDVIASVLGCSPSDVEAILLQIRRTLLGRTEAILHNESDRLPEFLEPEELMPLAIVGLVSPVRR